MENIMPGNNVRIEAEAIYGTPTIKQNRWVLFGYGFYKNP